MAREDTTIAGKIVHLYLIRHCQATGQAPDAPLTPLGFEQAARLAEVLARLGIARIVASTFLRARQTVEPLAARLGLAVETDERLIERNLSPEPLDDWLDRMRASWDDLDLALPGGESSRQATARGMAAITDILSDGSLPAVIVSHGNLLSLLLHEFDGRPGFDTWQQLSNPDVFEVVYEPPDRFTATRAWPK